IKMKVLFLILFLLGGSMASAASYSTTFAGSNENPISESGGRWLNGATDGLDWNDFAGSNHIAISYLAHGLADEVALLTGTWGANQTVQATVRVTDSTTSDFTEAELRLRSSISAHSCTGYECLFSLASPNTGANVYIGIVRWNGPSGNFTTVTNWQ